MYKKITAQQSDVVLIQVDNSTTSGVLLTQLDNGTTSGVVLIIKKGKTVKRPEKTVRTSETHR